jgi:hypothetical protein
MDILCRERDLSNKYRELVMEYVQLECSANSLDSIEQAICSAMERFRLVEEMDLLRKELYTFQPRFAG